MNMNEQNKATDKAQNAKQDSRRKFIQLGAAALSSAAFVGCGKSTGKSGAGKPKSNQDQANQKQDPNKAGKNAPPQGLSLIHI